MSATNLKSHVKNDSPCLSAKWKSPWTHLGRPSHFLFGSVTTTGHKKDSLEPNVVSVGHLYNPSSVKGLHSCNSQHGHKATQDKETFLSWGKFTVLWIHKAEKAVVLSQSRFDSAGLTVANTVQTASVYFLQQSGCDSNAQCPLSEEERIISV